jgi:ATP phosphoribosyltransferase regulatory subunit
MPAETAARFEALESQAAKIMGVFASAGYEPVAPAIIQPAGVFLDCIGEEIRRRTYVFTDPDGVELCLRPDLTIPSCRLYLERYPDAQAEARYAYNGPAFRYPNGDASNGDAGTSPAREFRQAGIECFGAPDREAADVEMLALTLEALREAGAPPFRLHFGDLGLFRVLLGALPIPQRWRDRLCGAFWRPKSFHTLISRLTTPAAVFTDETIAHLADCLDPSNFESARDCVGRYLDKHGVEFIGARSLDDITQRLIGAAADMHERPLDNSVVELLHAYLAISGTPAEAITAIERLTQNARLDISAAIDSCRRRQALLREAGIKAEEAQFSTVFGRQFEYYTGFVFQAELPERGRAGRIAGGGRYDGLLSAIGAPVSTPAIGAAIHTERLLAAKEAAA